MLDDDDDGVLTCLKRIVEHASKGGYSKWQFHPGPNANMTWRTTFFYLCGIMSWREIVFRPSKGGPLMKKLKMSFKHHVIHNKHILNKVLLLIKFKI